ncbi:MAG TPA: hypothetical protein VG125_14065 [Pirellulales bacterium]|jgi:hypothetical protein|nr:hypothetical protein [Pirellulales bacterium]
MQSSAMVALRTVIMITCLVAVPLAAVFGTALPKMVKSAFDGRGRRSLWNRPADDDEPAPPSVLAVDDLSPPRFVSPATSAEPAVAENTTRLPTARITGVRPIDDVAAGQPRPAAVETAPLWSPPPRTARAQQTRDMTAHFAPSPRPHRTDDLRSRHEPRLGTLQKTVYSQPHQEPGESTSGDAAEEPRALVAIERPAADNVLADGERRLRELGATYYRLETWGGEGQFYRCSCNIALATGSRVTRHFEATEAAPSRAIEAVVQQVSAWRTRRRGS